MSNEKIFLDEINKPRGQIDIEYAALIFASALQPEMKIDDALAAVDKQVNDFLADSDDFAKKNPFNSRYLVKLVSDVLGYRGDNVEYHSPENSLMNKVVDNRLGIPITLAGVYIAIGKRLGIEVHGVGFPGHFLIRIVEPDQSETLVDPFSHSIFDKAEFDRVVEQAQNQIGGFDQRWLENAHPHDMLIRMLENLKGAYLRLNDLKNAQICLNYQLLVRPDDQHFLQQLMSIINHNADDKGSKKLN